MLAPESDDRLDVVVLNVQAGTGPHTLLTGRGWVMSVLAANDDPANPAALSIIDGSTTQGDLLGRLRVAPSASQGFNPARPGWPIESGLTLSIDTGTLSVTCVVGKQR